MAQYALTTTVPVEKTRVEIEKTLVKYGATSFLAGFHQNNAFIQFVMKSKMVRFHVQLPKVDHFKKDGRGHIRSDSQLSDAYDQATRQRWRAMLLVLKAKLEAVESGIASFEEEFLSHILLPDGSTVGQWMIPQVEAAYKTGQMPSMLPGLPAHKE